MNQTQTIGTKRQSWVLKHPLLRKYMPLVHEDLTATYSRDLHKWLIIAPIIGVTTEAALGRFLNAMPTRFEAANGAGRLNAAIISADPATGKATRIERLNMSADEVERLAVAQAAPSRR